jgi:hypothetical protein
MHRCFITSGIGVSFSSILVLVMNFPQVPSLISNSFGSIGCDVKAPEHSPDRLEEQVLPSNSPTPEIIQRKQNNS